MLPQDFQPRTREQRQEFEWYKNEVFKPTKEDIIQQEIESNNYKINYLTEKLALYGIKFVESDDYSQIFHDYIFNLPDLQEFWWTHDRLQERYEYLIANENNLEWLYKIIYQLES